LLSLVLGALFEGPGLGVRRILFAAEIPAHPQLGIVPLDVFAEVVVEAHLMEI